MVDYMQKRFAPAESPTKFTSLPDWLKHATSLPGVQRPGLQKQMAEFISNHLQDDTAPAHVTKWLKGSIPGIARLRAIALWANVDPAELDQLAYRQREVKESRPRPRGGGRPAAKKKVPKKGA